MIHDVCPVCFEDSPTNAVSDLGNGCSECLGFHSTSTVREISCLNACEQQRFDLRIGATVYRGAAVAELRWLRRASVEGAEAFLRRLAKRSEHARIYIDDVDSFDARIAIDVDADAVVVLDHIPASAFIGPCAARARLRGAA